MNNFLARYWHESHDAFYEELPKLCVDVLFTSKLESHPKEKAAMGQKQNPAIWQKSAMLMHDY